MQSLQTDVVVPAYSREFLEKEIVCSDGWKVGKSKELLCDATSWKILQIDVELNEKIADEIGESVPLRRHHAPVDVSYIQGVGDVITLKITKDDIIRALSEYSKKARQSSDEKAGGPITV
jgi:sporulation protein YlmC with PRC-barrel domain